MPTYTVYVRSEENKKIVQQARNLGIAPRNLVRKLFNKGMDKEVNNAIEAKLDALFFLLEIMVSEVGYTSGATRAACASLPSAVSKGNELELGLKKLVEQIKTRLEKQGAEVMK